MEGKGKATLVKDGLLRGNARLYRLDPPYQRTKWDSDIARPCEFVIVSAVDAFDSGPEGAMDGSFKGDFDHERALRGLGYEVAQ